MSLISVIVPVYNVEKYLDNCIKSIVQQTYPNLEIILVDDGSSDRSGKICDLWHTKDQRIQVIHQKNTGAGAARNRALKLASGEYIAFVDSDDYLKSDMFERMLAGFDEDIDIVECDYIETTSDYGVFPVSKECEKTVYSVEEGLREHILDRCFRQLIWNKLYRRKCIGNIEFPTGKKIDDEFWTYQVIGNARKLARYEIAMYAYRQQPDSVMHTLSAEKRLQSVEAKQLRHEYIKEHFPQLLAESYHSLVMDCIYQVQKILRESGQTEKRRAVVYCKSVLATQYLKRNKRGNYSLKQQLWVSLANISLKTTCEIRNILKIGL